MTMDLTRWTVEYATPYGVRNGQPNYVTGVVLDPDPDSPSHTTLDDIPKIIANATGRTNIILVKIEREA